MSSFFRWPPNYFVATLLATSPRQEQAEKLFDSVHAPRVAAELGHTSPAMLYNTYRDVVRPEKAERYWRIEPTPDAANVVAFAGRPSLAHRWFTPTTRATSFFIRRQATNSAPTLTDKSVNVDEESGTPTGDACPVISTRRPVGPLSLCTKKSKVLSPETNKFPGGMLNEVNAVNPPLLLPVLFPLRRISEPSSSVAHKPLIEAVEGLSPLRSNVMR